MTIYHGVYVFGVRDSFGGVWVGVIANPSDRGHVNFIKDKDGKPIEYYGAIYLIPDWCIEHGLRCVVTLRTIEVEFPE